MAEADALVRDLGRVHAAESGQPVVGKSHTLSQIVGDHGSLAVMRGVIPGQGHHGRGFSGTEEAAEYREFSHIPFSFSISL